jgi:hypothetical protein
MLDDEIEKNKCLKEEKEKQANQVNLMNLS